MPDSLEQVLPWLLAVGLLYPMRRLERWLHQHIFKVGWLLTKNLQTTTILYYTIFLPGVFIHELIYWLVAGIVNVRAERAIRWPEAQAIAELRLKFIQLSKNAGMIRTAVISLSPLIGGIFVVWLISNNILHIPEVLAAAQAGGDGLSEIASRLAAIPDVWLWIYISFTISNTMMPDWNAVKGLKPLAISVVIVIVVAVLLGVADDLIAALSAGGAAQGINTLVLIFGFVIVVDLIFTAALGLIESLIERVTGDSATYQNGKLVAMRREEILQQRAQQRARQQQKQPARQRKGPSGPPSIYKLPLPIPGAPGKEAVPAEQVVVSKEARSPLPAGAPADDRAGPAVITGTATPRPADDDTAAHRIVNPNPGPARGFNSNASDADEELDQADDEELS